MHNKIARTKIFYEQSNFKDQLTYSEYRQILRTYHALVMREMILEGKSYRPHKDMGVWRIQKRKANLNRRRRHLITKELYDYRHSDGYYARFDWSKKDVTFDRGSTHFKFLPARVNTKMLSQAITNQNTIHKYYE